MQEQWEDIKLIDSVYNYCMDSFPFFVIDKYMKNTVDSENAKPYVKFYSLTVAILA